MMVSAKVGVEGRGGGVLWEELMSNLAMRIAPISSNVDCTNLKQWGLHQSQAMRIAPISSNTGFNILGGSQRGGLSAGSQRRPFEAPEFNILQL